MKKLVIYMFIFSIVIAACRKEDNPKIPVLERVPLAKLSVDKTGDATISALAPDAFSGKFVVDLYYPNDTKPTKFDIVVIKNGNAAVVKTIQANVTTYPTTLTLTGTMIKSLFGVSSVLGDSYTIGADVTVNGKTYPAFSTLGGTTKGGVSSLAGSTPQITFSAVCQFKMSDYGAVGASVPYTVVEDGWLDYAVGQTIPVTIIDATHLSFMYGANDAKPIVITVNPADNTTSVAKVTYGNYGPGPTFSAVSVANSPSNVVAPCEVKVGVKLTHTDSSGGGYGDYVITLKRK
ncbi:hypothetical protein ACXZ1K_03075 [Pedobacter sp. PWIIR3]